MDLKAGKERKAFYWNGYSFPFFESLTYNADGPMRDNPDRLFILDKNERFSIYFEKDCEGFNEFLKDNECYDNMELRYKNKNLQLYFPLKENKRNMTAGYFKLSFLDEENINLFGSLNIEPPENFLKGLRDYEDIKNLFLGFELKRKDGDASR